MSKETVSKIIQIVDSLPSLPDTLKELRTIRDSEVSGINDAIPLIASDPGLMVDLIKLANSALYGYPKRIDTVDLALRIVGLENFITYVLTIFSMTSMQSLFNNSTTLRQYVYHSRQCAEVCKVFGEFLNYPKKKIKQLYMGGIIHDIGRLVLKSLENNIYIQILGKNELDFRNITVVEKELFGMDHSEVGELILEKWNFPDYFVDIVRNHHNPLNSKFYTKECMIIFLSNFFIIDLTGMDIKEIFNEEITDILEISSQELIQIYNLSVNAKNVVYDDLLPTSF